MKKNICNKFQNPVGGGGILGYLPFCRMLDNLRVSSQAVRRGFTLAEVLITLGIIGVVAAITLPTLLNKIQDKQNIARWKKIYSVITQAHLQTISDGYPMCSTSRYFGLACPDKITLKQTFPNGGGYYNEFSYYSPGVVTSEFQEQFFKKFKGAILCDSTDNCKTSSYNPGKIRPKTLAGGIMSSYNYGGPRIKLLTGELIMFGSSHGGPWLSVDVNGPENGPNVVGRDIFVMKVYDNVVLPMGAEGTFNPKKNGDECLCGKEYGDTGDNPAYFAGAGGSGIAASGACCSAKYIYGK